MNETFNSTQCVSLCVVEDMEPCQCSSEYCSVENMC